MESMEEKESVVGTRSERTRWLSWSRDDKFGRFGKKSSSAIEVASFSYLFLFLVIEHLFITV